MIGLPTTFDGILAGHGIDDEQGLRRPDGLVEGGNLVHQLLIDREAAGGIDDHDAVALGTGLGDGVLRDADRILLPFFGIDGNADALAEDLELLDGGRAEGVAGCEEDLHAALALDMQGELAGEGRLTGTIEAGDEDDRGAALDVDILRLAAHEGGQFVVDDLDHHLLRLHGRQHVLAHRLVLDRVAELLGHLVAHIGVQEGLPDVLDGFGDVDFGDFPLTFQYLERPFQPFAQVLEHIPLLHLELQRYAFYRSKKSAGPTGPAQIAVGPERLTPWERWPSRRRR